MDPHEPHHLPDPGEPVDDSDLGERAELERISALREWYEPEDLNDYLKRSPGETETAALATLAFSGGFYGWLGIAIAGAVFATPLFPCIGTWFGGLVAGGMAFGPTIVSLLLFVALRGRLPVATSMAWAGALAGIFSVGVLGPNSRTLLPLASDPIFERTALALTASLCGAIGARWTTGLAASAYKMEPGLGVRPWNQFTIVDLLLLTTWVAIVAALVRVCVPGLLEHPVAFAVWLAVSLAAVGIAELAAAGWRHIRRPRRTPNAD